MRTKLLLFAIVIVSQLIFAIPLRADQLEMQNGERYVGRVVSLSSDTIIFQSEVLGKIKVPRKTVARLSFGTNAIVSNVSAATTPPPPTRTNALAAARTNGASTNLDFSSALRRLAGNTNAIQQIREQMLSTSPEASKKYNELINGLLSGQINLNDIRREAKSSADQLRAYKRELGPEAGDLLDTYLDVLDGFLNETTPGDKLASPKNSTSPAR